MKSRIRFLVTCLAGMLVVGAGCSHPSSPRGAGAPSSSNAQATTVGTANANEIAATDSRFHDEGRFDRSSPNQVGVIWQASRIGLDFSGPTLILNFAAAKGQNYFDLQVDDQSAVIEVKEGASAAIPAPFTLSSGRHALRLAKRSEAAAGTAFFRGVTLADGAEAWAPAKPDYKTKFEFFGDSITAGACNEDGAVDQWESRRTHNAMKSYVAFVADAFSADHRNISVSGMGIVEGYVPFQAGQIWNKLYPSPDSPEADLSGWKPDVVFVNYGENDTSFSQKKGEPFPPSFTDGYVALIRAIRKAYPEAEIVLLRGGMGGGAKNLDLRKAWDASVQQLQNNDQRIHPFVFEHFSLQHPRVADDRAMADELIAWLKKQPFARTL